LDPATLATLIVGALATLISIFAYMSSSRATKVQADTAARAVDAGAYERARTIYESSLKALEIQVARLQEQSERMRKQLDTAEGTISELRSQLTQMQQSREQEIRDLRAQVSQRDSTIAELKEKLERKAA